MAGCRPPGSPLFLVLHTHVEIWIVSLVCLVMWMGFVMMLLRTVLILRTASTMVLMMDGTMVVVASVQMVELPNRLHYEMVVEKVRHWGLVETLLF